jgi:hypothetical protein
MQFFCFQRQSCLSLLAHTRSFAQQQDLMNPMHLFCIFEDNLKKNIMTEFNERIEGEIKSQEKEMLRKIIINKYHDKSLAERIQYVMSNYAKDSWTDEEMFAKLTELGLNGNDSMADIKNIFNDPALTFPSKVNTSSGK